MEQILIVEDDATLNAGLAKALRTEARQIVSCLNGKAAREQLLCNVPSIVILDINLPDGSGLELLGEWKKAHPDLPVILLTANDTDMDIVDGLEKGADDYITKPFSVSVLRARVNTQLNRVSRKTLKRRFETDRFQFDFEEMRFIADNEPVELSKTEQRFLRLLVENEGQTLRREQLIDRIWTDGANFVDENALSVTIKRLRDKLGAQEEIRTVYGLGYMWVRENG